MSKLSSELQKSKLNRRSSTNQSQDFYFGLLIINTVQEPR